MQLRMPLLEKQNFATYVPRLFIYYSPPEVPSGLGDVRDNTRNFSRSKKRSSTPDQKDTRRRTLFHLLAFLEGEPAIATLIKRMVLKGTPECEAYKPNMRTIHTVGSQPARTPIRPTERDAFWRVLSMLLDLEELGSHFFSYNSTYYNVS